MEHEEIQNSKDAVLEINKKKKDFKIELALFFVLGFLVGITFKTEASKRITIGFEDYKVKEQKDSYDFSAMKRKVIEKSVSENEDAVEMENLEEVQTEPEVQNSEEVSE